MSADRDVVLYFQSARRRRGSSDTVPQLLDQMEVPTEEVKGDRALHNGEVSRAVVASVRDRFLTALRRANLTNADAARYMGISESLLNRQLWNVDNQQLSALRMEQLPDAFHREYVALYVEGRRIGVVCRDITITGV